MHFSFSSWKANPFTNQRLVEELQLKKKEKEEEETPQEKMIL